MTTAAPKENKTVIAFTTARKQLFALMSDMINQWSNFFQSVIQHYWPPKQTKQKIIG